MITLSTGLPGAGKTLYTIAYVKALAEKESRPVFYSGIKDLALPWHEIQAENWMDCPEGSIVVIDECQRIFRPRGNGAAVPAFVSALETHRHKGLDLFLVTQHPMLMDANVRRLTEKHFHISRRFGMQRATIFQFESCKDQPLAKHADAQRLDWKYPKEVFEYYKSAEVHTVKRRIPIQYLIMFGVPVIVAGIVWGFVSRHYQNGQVVIPGATPQGVVQGQGGPVGSSSSKVEKPKAMTQAEYVEAHKPRLDGLAYTAPIYDEVTKPQEAPLPVACVTSKSKGCRCYSQQATRLAMSDAMCSQILANGFFVPFEVKSQVRAAAEPKRAVLDLDRAAPGEQLVPTRNERGAWVGLLPVEKPAVLSAYTK